MTEKLFDGFPYTSAKEWLAQITQDLKGKALEEMLWSPDGDLKINPYVHAEDSPDPLPPLSTFGKWLIGETVDVKDEIESNHQLIEALNSGTESLRLICTDQVNWPELLKGVDLSIIHVGLHISGDIYTSVQDFFSYADSRFQSAALHITVSAGNMTGHPYVRYCAPPNNPEYVIQGLVSSIMETIEAANWDSARLAQMDISLNIGMHYLIEIARLRALRILWNNVASVFQFSLPAHFAIEAQTITAKPEEDPNSHMIRQTMMGVAAVLGGADRIYINPASGKQHPESFYKHIARNIHHLLRYESKFTEISDPVAGAYYLDRLTRDIVNNVWGLLPPRIKNSGR